MKNNQRKFYSYIYQKASRQEERNEKTLNDTEWFGYSQRFDDQVETPNVTNQPMAVSVFEAQLHVSFLRNNATFFSPTKMLDTKKHN